LSHGSGCGENRPKHRTGAELVVLLIAAGTGAEARCRDYDLHADQARGDSGLWHFGEFETHEPVAQKNTGALGISIPNDVLLRADHVLE